MSTGSVVLSGIRANYRQNSLGSHCELVLMASLVLKLS
jgi:hypothetical protein